MKPLVIAAIYLQGMNATPYGPFLNEPPRRPTESRCKSSGDEIVVCGRIDHPTNQRLRQSSTTVELEGLPRAEVELGDAKVGLSLDGGSVGGFTSNRMMLGIKVPLGRRK